ncbi:hypothetical protein BDN70DRAFT_887137 [Pholiota conissans]|uniref:Uncharacterized protein n=1 Tax=Pholiota conissans TaxID=109636 RepID=A0A9P5YM51_9AGAR|nr:hypothetical protein BDN70DRAFT_887137 [Pholiota conissans]
MRCQEREKLSWGGLLHSGRPRNEGAECVDVDEGYAYTQESKGGLLMMGEYVRAYMRRQ